MPVELTPSGSFTGQPIDFIPRSIRGWASGPNAVALSHPAPALPPPILVGTGPARLSDCLPGPNRCLPNGLRNPWAPYAGATYLPSSVAAANMQATSVGGMSVLGGGGGAGSVISPRSLNPMGGSVIAPTAAGGSAYGSVISRPGLGGMRPDDGWDGSQGRAHRGVQPDLQSTAGALPPVAASASAWLYSPSSPANHARLSPNSPQVYLQPQMPSLQPTPPSSLLGGSHRPRRASIRPVPIEDCAECKSQCVECQAQSRRPRSVSQSHDSRSLPPAAASGQGPYKRLAGSPQKGSPLRQTPESPLARRVSGRSHRSG
ncbi:hypothetical protein DB88DRAFT_98682 [Papiliotrema laurentii]|uniref:Uncharacterized protein n=1 Tax=Papiliotrema laurentii TaxID=5418 RepID=A0AAD9FM14_PAPLA|nr:hypothetical protein DB88DRAFT_98682 [Papiliotrema laurentii]